MKTVMLEIEDSKFEQFITVINSLKSDLIAKFQVQKDDDKILAVDLANDPLAQELKRRIHEIDDGSVELIPHSEVMSRIYEKWEQKCI